MISRRALGAGALGLAASWSLAACGRDSSPASEENEKADPIADGPATGTLTMWAHGAPGEILPELLKDFQDENPDVDITVTPVPWDAAHNKYQTSIAGGTAPDLAQMGTTWMADFAYGFDPTPEDIPTDDFVGDSLTSTEVGGTRYGLPWFPDVQAVFYHREMMAKAGFSEFPEDWEGFAALARAMQEKAGAKWGVWLQAGGTDSFQKVLPWAWTNGAQLLNEDETAWTIDTPEMIGGLEYHQSFFTDGVADKHPDPASGAKEAAFAAGTVPMFLGSPNSIKNVTDAAEKGFAEKFGVATYPKKETDGTSFLGGSNVVVFKQTENRDAAWKLAQWLATPEVQVKWYQLSGNLPTLGEAWDDPALSEDEKVAVFGEQLKDAQPTPALTTWAKVSTEADSQLEEIAVTGKDVATAMQELQSAAESVGLGDQG